MNAIICGGRRYSCKTIDGKPVLVPRTDDIAWLDSLHEQYGITCVFDGGAAGGDALGRYWANLRRIPIRKFPALWGKHGRAAGPIRNGEMVAAASPGDLWIGFPGGEGTSGCRRLAEGAGLLLIDRVPLIA